MSEYNSGFQLIPNHQNLEHLKFCVEYIMRHFKEENANILDIEIERDAENNLNIYMKLDGKMKPYPKDE